MTQEKSISVAENIITWQGEGKDSGVRMLLLRFQKCNRIVSGIGCPWCDTRIKLRNTNLMSMKLSEIQSIINKEKCGLMITGGEPTFWKNLEDTTSILNELDYPIANVETNGHRLLELIDNVSSDKYVNYSYSPKIFTETELKIETELTRKMAIFPNVFFKVVYEDRWLIIEYLKFLELLGVNQRVFLMPKGITLDELLKNSPETFDTAEEFKFNFSSRSHIVYSFI